MLVTNPFACLGPDSVAPGKTGLEKARDRVGFNKHENDFSRSFESKMRSKTEAAESTAKKPKKELEPNDRNYAKKEISSRQESRLKKLLERILPENVQSSKTADQNIAVLVQGRINGVLSRYQKVDDSSLIKDTIQDEVRDILAVLDTIKEKTEENSLGLADLIMGVAKVELAKIAQDKDVAADKSADVSVLADGEDVQQAVSSVDEEADGQMTKNAPGIEGRGKNAKTLVVDLREGSSSADSQGAKGSLRTQDRVESREQGTSDFTKLTVNQNGAGDTAIKTVETPVQNVSSLRQSLPAEIVKQSTIILKGNDNGEIRMILKPDNLGQVKINVELKDNRVMAKIVVDNQAIKEILDSQMGTLKDQFLAQGYADASVNVFVGQESNGKRQDFSGFADTQKGIKTFEDQVPEYFAGYSGEQTVVNVMA